MSHVVTCNHFLNFYLQLAVTCANQGPHFGAAGPGDTGANSTVTGNTAFLYSPYLGQFIPARWGLC